MKSIFGYFSKLNELYANASLDHANMMVWFEKELENAQKLNEKVLLLGHISPVGRWLPWKLEFFYRLIKKYHSILLGSFWGHNHCDQVLF